ncbi:unnamed protein product, partial [Ectocarpus sp. 12 AP-2014]
FLAHEHLLPIACGARFAKAQQQRLAQSSTYSSAHHSVVIVVCALSARPALAKPLLQARNDRGCTPLALASDYGRAHVAGMLVVAGAEVESRDHRGNTPLMHASREV